ncbi:hypothetical protein [Pseudobdellovibrio exovorus]|uniref:NAD-dependent epimerase/dehydratase domain-containing protein n=1 Tax=Pseudobdellovibrio exovorus JSS TaxID=1184267 RepID=M4VA58_9BACT|nr:hypothetical protein [Pseudobdellovibrio exovorus]AGH95350.1 hypothetical protein A11Q_1134 [Pseudobdellovibrio exovorus JSS]
MNKTWGIVGLGWLGSELATKLKKLGDNSWGTRSNVFNFQTDQFPETFCDVLFLNTPPLPQMSPEVYVQKIYKAARAKIIFISSTSVYGASEGLITESSMVAPQTESARWLVDVELLLRQKFNEDLTIVRAGGLIGGERHPVFHLSRKKEVTTGKHLVNLIHRSDLIGICLSASKASNIPLVNAVAPFHPKKEEYYNQWATQLNVPKPIYTGGTESNRQIDSEILPLLYPHWICPKLDFL